MATETPPMRQGQSAYITRASPLATNPLIGNKPTSSLPESDAMISISTTAPLEREPHDLSSSEHSQHLSKVTLSSLPLSIV